jgi:hypothetical protein
MDRRLGRSVGTSLGVGWYAQVTVWIDFYCDVLAGEEDNVRGIVEREGATSRQRGGYVYVNRGIKCRLMTKPVYPDAPVAHKPAGSNRWPKGNLEGRILRAQQNVAGQGAK